MGQCILSSTESGQNETGNLHWSDIKAQATYIRWDPFGGSSISEMLHWKLIQLHAKPKMSAQVEIPDAWAL